MELNRIINDDCLKVMKEIPDKYFDLCITDPPYGIDFQSAWRTDKSKWKPKIANDDKPFTDFLPELFRIMKDDSAILVFTRYDVEEEFRIAMRKAGFIDKQQIIWDKVVHGMGDLEGDFASQHENIIFATKGNYKFPGERPKSVLRQIRVLPEELKHPNEKPVALMSALIRYTSKDGDKIIEPFVGSGATLVSAKELKRDFLGIEIDPTYCAVAEERLKRTRQSLFL